MYKTLLTIGGGLLLLGTVYRAHLRWDQQVQAAALRLCSAKEAQEHNGWGPPPGQEAVFRATIPPLDEPWLAPAYLRSQGIPPWCGDSCYSTMSLARRYSCALLLYRSACQGGVEGACLNLETALDSYPETWAQMEQLEPPAIAPCMPR